VSRLSAVLAGLQLGEVSRPGPDVYSRVARGQRKRTGMALAWPLAAGHGAVRLGLAVPLAAG